LFALRLVLRFIIVVIVIVVVNVTSELRSATQGDRALHLPRPSCACHMSH
jgi:hypothetical protein